MACQIFLASAKITLSYVYKEALNNAKSLIVLRACERIYINNKYM